MGYRIIDGKVFALGITERKAANPHKPESRRGLRQDTVLNSRKFVFVA
jgi:hypothetical protein